MSSRTHTSDLVLDVWIDADPEGDEDVWLKDADELDAAVDQLRYTSRQRDAVRALADHACRELFRDWSWPMDEVAALAADARTADADFVARQRDRAVGPRPTRHRQPRGLSYSSPSNAGG